MLSSSESTNMLLSHISYHPNPFKIQNLLTIMHLFDLSFVHFAFDSFDSFWNRNCLLKMERKKSPRECGKKKCVIIMVYLPLSQLTWQPSCLSRRCNTLIVLTSMLLLLLMLVLLLLFGFVSLYKTNMLSLYAFWMRCFRSRHLIVDVKSILPVASRFKIRLGIEKLTADRMWPSWNSFELRQSRTINDFVGDRNSDWSHSFETASILFSGIFLGFYF